MPVIIISVMVTFNKCLHENTNITQQCNLSHSNTLCYFIVFLFSIFFRWRHMIAIAIITNPILIYIVLCNTSITDVEYTHENDKKSGSDECPNKVSIKSQPAPVIHCILHFKLYGSLTDVVSHLHLAIHNCFQLCFQYWLRTQEVPLESCITMVYLYMHAYSQITNNNIAEHEPWASLTITCYGEESNVAFLICYEHFD